MTLSDFESAFLTFWIGVNKITSQIETGEDPRPLIPLLRQHLAESLGAFYHWQTVKWGPPTGGPAS